MRPLAPNDDPDHELEPDALDPSELLDVDPPEEADPPLAPNDPPEP